MIEIAPLKNDLFLNDKFLNKIRISKYCYINSIEIITKLLTIELPIQNKRIAIRNILDFLTFLDIERNNKENNTLLVISSKKLSKFFSRNKYFKYLEILKDMKILSNVPYDDGKYYSYIDVDIRPKQYRIHNDYLSKEDLCIIILDGDRSKFEFKNDLPKLDKRYINTIEKLEINTKEAIISEMEYCMNNNLKESSLRHRISRIFYTKRKRFLKKGSRVNRIYHSFSNVSKVSRKHINIKMFNIDIKNCQPLLLIAYLNLHSYSSDDQYKYDCESGNFYEKFIGINNCDRDEVKVKLYKNIFFGFNKSSKFNKKFKELYPLTWESLNIITKEKESLAYRLQNLEAELFNGLIPIKSHNYFTLFDAIYFDDINDVTKLNNLIKGFFNRLGIKVTTVIEF